MKNLENLKHVLYSTNASPYQRRLALKEFEGFMETYINVVNENEMLHNALHEKEEFNLRSLSISDLHTLREILDDRYQRTNLIEYKFKMEKVEYRIIEITDRLFKI